MDVFARPSGRYPGRCGIFVTESEDRAKEIFSGSRQQCLKITAVFSRLSEEERSFRIAKVSAYLDVISDIDKQLQWDQGQKSDSMKYRNALFDLRDLTESRIENALTKEKEETLCLEK